MIYTNCPFWDIIEKAQRRELFQSKNKFFIVSSIFNNYYVNKSSVQPISKCSGCVHSLRFISRKECTSFECIY